jgi:tRNA (pseudouridine54-N1)-methyltransferase
MTIIFFIKSNTVNINKYTIKDIPGSSGRLDVISRCILATLLEGDSFDINSQIWVFLDNYGTFIFSPDYFNYDEFPKNEILFTDYFVKFLQENNNVNHSLNPLDTIKKSNMGILEAIKHFKRLKYNLYILQEQGTDLLAILNRIKEKEYLLFILGSQVDDFLNLEELVELKIPTLSFGNQSYLASSVIRLLKLYILG